MRLTVYSGCKEDTRGVFFDLVHPQVESLFDFLPDYLQNRKNLYPSLESYTGFVSHSSIPASDFHDKEHTVFASICQAVIDMWESPRF